MSHSRRTPGPYSAEAACQRKFKYGTEGSAEMAARRSEQGMERRRGKKAVVPISVYRCHVCGLWHLTSRPQ